MSFPPKEERIGELEEDLYSRDAPPIAAQKRPELTAHDKLNEYGWAEDKTLVQTAADLQDSGKKMSFATKAFMASALFFVAAAIIAGFVILAGVNVVSSKNVDISVQGPISVAAGEEVSLDVVIKNNNNVTLNSGTIYIEYPEGTRLKSDITKDLTRDQLDLGLVQAGGSVTKTVKVVLFGEKDSVKQIKVSVDYRPKDSNATFSKEKTFDITIKSSPITMTVDFPREVNAGQEIEIKIEVASNSNTVIRDLLVRAEYPFGFNFASASPAPVFAPNVWRIGDLEPNEKRTIVIDGSMQGQNEEERTFRFITGTVSPTDERQIGIGYIATQESLQIKKPFIGLGLKLNSQEGDYIATVGERISGTLNWTNNVPVNINDASIQIKLTGQGFDRNRVSPGTGGFFRSADNTIVWDENFLSDLASIEPGESGSVNFVFFAPQSSQQILSQGRNMQVGIEASMTGTRFDAGATQQIRSSASGLAKVSTGLVVGGQALYSIGPFQNTGPIPPRADRETTYTIVFNLSNSFNDASNVSVTTQLPPNVRWLGQVNPSAEPVEYNVSNRTVSWSVPEIRAGVGYNSSGKEMAFKVALLPSVNQVGNAPNLTGDIIVRGTDRFTNSSVQSSKPPLNTRLSSDPTFRNGDEKVSE